MNELDYGKASNALGQIRTLTHSRRELREYAEALTKLHHGPQGVSSDTQFVNDVLRLFDAHVAHLVERYKAELAIAIDKL